MKQAIQILMSANDSCINSHENVVILKMIINRRIFFRTCLAQLIWYFFLSHENINSVQKLTMSKTTRYVKHTFFLSLYKTDFNNSTDEKNEHTCNFFLRLTLYILLQFYSTTIFFRIPFYLIGSWILRIYKQCLSKGLNDMKDMGPYPRGAIKEIISW